MNSDHPYRGCRCVEDRARQRTRCRKALRTDATRRRPYNEYAAQTDQSDAGHMQLAPMAGTESCRAYSAAAWSVRRSNGQASDPERNQSTVCRLDDAVSAL